MNLRKLNKSGKKLSLILLMHTVFFSVYAADASKDDLSGYSKGNLSLPPTPKITNPAFEDGKTGWILPKGFRVVRSEGLNGTSALFYERTNPKEYKYAKTKVKLQAGARYRFSGWVKCENVSKGRWGATICLEFAKNGKWLSGRYPNGLHGTKDWTYIESSVAVPENADSCSLILVLGPKCTGKVWFDDVTIRPDAPRIEMDVVYPAFRIITPKNGLIRVNVYNEDTSINERDLKVRFEAGKKSVTASLKKHVAKADMSGLPVGPVPLKLSLLDTRRKLILAESTCDLTCALADLPAPENACLIDKYGRAIVNGKPYMPVGLYMYTVNKEDLDRIAESPFNCVIPQQSMHLKLLEKDDMIIPRPQYKGILRDCIIMYKYSPETIWEALDYCHKKGLKVIFSMQGAPYKGSKNAASTRWNGITGTEEIVKAIINKYKSHPALLGWFTVDEKPASMIEILNARRKLINQLDPFHPTWGVHYKPAELRSYTSACDIIGTDYYPILRKTSRDMNGIANTMDALDATGLQGYWVVLQLFNWGVYNAGGDPGKFKKDFADPSEKQMRAMTILAALRGAKGFTYYSYNDLKRPANPNRFIGKPPYTMEYFERRWKKAKRIAQMLRDLEPFILSIEKAPGLKIKQEKGTVQAREFRDKNGNIRILIAGIGPGEASAVITTTAPMPLKSVYGNCKALGNNRYRFVGENICSDILTGTK